MSPAAKKAPILVIDTGSPRSSVALGRPRRLYATRELELRQASERLLDMVREVLAERGLHLGDLEGVVALQGPGSFTGLRIGLATVLGFHQALKLPATAFPTLPVLALAARDLLAAPEGENAQRRPNRVIAAVDALRGEFYAQTFSVGSEVRALDAPRLWSRGEIVGSGLPAIGAGLSGLAEDPHDTRWLEPPPLAPLTLRLLGKVDWDAGKLVQPIYYRPPAVTLPASSPVLPPSAPEPPR